MHPLAHFLNRLRRATVATPEGIREANAEHIALMARYADDRSGPVGRLRGALPAALAAYAALPASGGAAAIGYRLSDHLDLAQWPERELVINGVMRLGEVGLMVGPPKTKKTWMVLDAVHCMACGGDWLGLMTCPKPRRCLVVDCECDPGELHRRATLIRDNAKNLVIGNRVSDRYAGIDLEMIQYAPLRGALGIRENLDTRMERLEWTIQDARAEFVVVDTASAFFPLRDENDNAEISELMGRILDVATRCEAALLLVHHTPKVPASRQAVDMAAGAGAWTRRADTVIGFQLDKNDALAIRGQFRARSVMTPGPLVVDFPTRTNGVVPIAADALDEE